MKRLVIDARALLPKLDGLGNYIRQHVPTIAAQRDFQTILIAGPAMADFWRRQAPNADVVISECRPSSMRQHVAIPRIVARLGADLYFYPTHDPPLFAPRPFVFTIHDMTPHQIRPYFEDMDLVKTAVLRRITARGAARAAAIFAVSDATRSAIGDILGEPAMRKTIVTPNGSERPAPRRRDVVTDRLLYVGTDRPHKNLFRLVEAYAVAAAERQAIAPLEIIGGLRREAELRAQIERLGLRERVVVRGHLPDADLERAYDHAIALVMPSLSEGFGIPILEAMRRGVPVITSSAPACVEVAADAALIVDPRDVASIARALNRIDADGALRDRLAIAGPQRAAAFSWAASTARMLEVLRAHLRV